MPAFVHLLAMASRYAMILAGGAGTRLWPMSRVARPKQLLPLLPRNESPAGTGAGGTGERGASLLEMAAGRLEGIVPPERRYICTSERYRAQIRAAVPEFTDDRILGEPEGRDTAGAIGLAAAVFAREDPEAVFIVLTADHVIRPLEVFRERVDLAFRLVEEDGNRLVTFSITPTYAATGYGYVERARELPGLAGSDAGAAFKVARFVEKPPPHKAQAYVESGVFGWNSGMFVFKAATYLACVQRYRPEIWRGLMQIAEAWGTERQEAILRQVYPTLEKVSVDTAVMEPASADQRVSLVTVVADVEWLDVGSWPSYGQTLARDEGGNRLGGAAEAPGATVLEGCRDTLVVSEEAAHTIALLGCEGLIVVHTRDATLIMPAERAEELKKLHSRAPERLK